MATTDSTIHELAAPAPTATIPLRSDKRWAYLERQKTIRVATTDEDGNIYLSPLWYVTKERKIFLSIDAGSRHGDNARAGRPLSGLVDTGEEYATVHGVRIVGRMVVVNDPALEEGLSELLFEKYFYVGHPYAESYFEFGAAAGRRFYELVPDKIVGWDMREVAFPPGAEARSLPNVIGDRLVD